VIDVFFEALRQFTTSPELLGFAFVGVLLGILLGILPGVGSTMAVAVLLPLTYGFEPVTALTFLIAVYSASTYAGSLSAILLGIPGTAQAIMTQVDGYPMMKAGRGGEAMTYATLASTFGGLMGVAFLMVAAPVVARLAYNLRSPDYTALAVFALATLAFVSPGATFKGLMAAAFGLVLAMVGLDSMTFLSRLDFGVSQLQGGLNIIPVIVGVFGLAEVLRGFGDLNKVSIDVKTAIKRIFPPWDELKTMWPSALRGGVIGWLIGALPAIGSPVAVVIAYFQEKRFSRTPERFGTGAPEGVVAPESCNNACVGATLIPMMTLGIPGDTVTAVLLGAFLIHGLQPGPRLFQENPLFVASVYVGLTAAILMTVLVALPLLRYVVRIVSIPKRILLPVIAMLTVVGAYAVNNSLFDVGVMIGFGLLGYLMGNAGIPIAPLVFGLILSPIVEENFRRSLLVSGGDWSVFVTRPISLTLLILTVLMLVAPLASGVVRRLGYGRKGDRAGLK